MLVRRGTPSDAAALATLRLRAMDSPVPDPDDFVALFVDWVNAHASSHLPFVAVADDELIGMAWLLVADRVPSPDNRHRRCGDIQSVFVLPAHRSRGIGTALLDAVLTEAKALDLEHITVHANTRALPLYHRATFTPDPLWLRWPPTP